MSVVVVNVIRYISMYLFMEFPMPTFNKREKKSTFFYYFNKTQTYETKFIQSLFFLRSDNKNVNPYLLIRLITRTILHLQDYKNI